MAAPADGAGAVRAHQEQLTVLVPAAQMGDRVAFAVDEVDQGTGQGQRGGGTHGGQDLVQVAGRPRRGGRTRAVHGRGGAQPQFERCQGVAGGGIDQQGAGQLVAAIRAFAEEELVRLAGVAVVVEGRPIMDEQAVLGRGILEGATAGLLQGCDEVREGNGVVGEEAPGGLGAGKGGREARQGGWSGGQGRGTAEVFLHKLYVAALQPRLERWHRKLILLLYAAALV